MDEEPRKATAWEALRTVLSAFVGVRRRDAHEKVRVTLPQIVFAAVIAAALFVLGLITVVRLVTR